MVFIIHVSDIQFILYAIFYYSAKYHYLNYNSFKADGIISQGKISWILKSINFNNKVDITCPFFAQCIHAVGLRFNLSTHGQWLAMFQQFSTQDEISPNNKKEHKEILAITIFVVWRERCNQIFRNANKLVSLLPHEVRED